MFFDQETYRNETIVLLAVTTLLLAPSLDATSVQCISQRCAKDQKPPACCKPPPCEFFYELKVAKASSATDSRGKCNAPALAVANVDDARGQAKYEANLREVRSQGGQAIRQLPTVARLPADTDPHRRSRAADAASRCTKAAPRSTSIN